MEELQTSYEAKRATYDALVAANDPTKLAEIQRLNGELAALLTRMAEILASTKDSARDITVYRDALLQQLVGIQNDASIMKEQRDQYTTLHMLQIKRDGALVTSLELPGIVARGPRVIGAFPAIAMRVADPRRLDLAHARRRRTLPRRRQAGRLLSR